MAVSVRLASSPPAPRPLRSSARAALDQAFTVLKRDRVTSLIHPENRASIRVAERLGERLQGRIQHYGCEMLC